jgi:predicted Rossmann fold nucleotide-binding protein DprA/Smf involved in DNA uptake
LPGDLFSGPKPFLSADQNERISQLTSDAGAVMVDAENLRLRGIWICPISAEQYPMRFKQRLGKQAPPVLFGVGEAPMLEAGGVGVVGSRDVSTDGAAAAMDVARRAVASGKQVVSGAARGVDQLAMNASNESGGSVVGVLADSLLERIRSSEVLASLDSGLTCLITQQHPSVGFTPAAAMSRNKLIYAIADVTVVIASDLESGGTWSGATEALRSNYGRVAVYRGPGSGPGNAKLGDLGATALLATDELDSLTHDEPGQYPTQLRLVD